MDGTHDFNPRAPCGARRGVLVKKVDAVTFQSTRPMRGATFSNASQVGGALFQSTRPMRGATLTDRRSHRMTRISIHAPHAGRDRGDRPADGERVNFNPRAPCGARRGWPPPPAPRARISIHAPHAGRDAGVSSSSCRTFNFNPRAPCGARHLALPQFPKRSRDFNPRAPCGARPGALYCCEGWNGISIHAPHAGRDGMKHERL